MKKQVKKLPTRNAKGSAKSKGSAASSYREEELSGGIKPETKREIAGVAAVALGVLLALFIYAIESSVLGSAISTICFGLMGVFSYILAPLLVALGIIRIVKSQIYLRKSAVISALIGLVLILTIIHCATYPINGSSLFSYYGSAFSAGSVLKSGGGILGSLLSYPMLLLLGNAGAIIFLVAAVLITALISTRLSLLGVGKSVKKAVDKNVEKVRQKKEAKKPSIPDDVINFPEHFPVSTGDNASDIGLQNVFETKKAKKEKKKAFEKKVDSWEASLDFLPLQGPLKTAVDPISSDQNGFDIDIDAINRAAGVDNIPVIDEVEPPVLIPLDDKPATLSAVCATDDAALNQSAQSQSPAAFDPPSCEGELCDDNAYKEPLIAFLNMPQQRALNTESPSETAKLLINTLASFKIAARITNVSVGPVVTRYELQPAQGIRVNKITALSNDLALALAAPRVRIEAPIPGKAAIGIEVPNKSTSMVYLREIIESNEFKSLRSPLSFALGKDIAGKIIVSDLQRMPHLLIAGATGAGKSVCVNDIILSMIYKSSPAQLRMILIDPKVVEFQVYAGLPHLLVPVVTDVKKAAGALRWAVTEMEQRYQAMARVNARDLDTYNARLKSGESELPRIVVIIDELADLMMVAAKEIEESICRIAQLGRACGIHLIVATQRPSVDVITGLIKANIPSRIAFMVSSAVDSRVILDSNGAEKLLGRGDMLFHANGDSKPVRVQCAFVTIDEVEKVIEYFGVDCEKRTFNEEALTEISVTSAALESDKSQSKYEDELLPDAVRILLDTNQASISMLQRRLRVGYARAARLIDIMEQRGIVSSYDGSKPRKLLIDYGRYEQLFGTRYYPQADADAPSDDGAGEA